MIIILVGMSKKMITLVLIITSICAVSAQRQHEKWYFGWKGGLDFATATPTVITNSKMYATGGSASICDKTTGALLFYTGIDTIYDNTGAVMQNGTGFSAVGNFEQTSCQGVLIVPDPGNSNKYYVFNSSTNASGLTYNVVDMSLNGGKGSVILKNQQLLNASTEKITGTAHCNGTDYWVSVHKPNSDSIYVYPVKAAGVGAPEISRGVIVHAKGFPIGVNNLGQMKFSPDGQKLAMVSTQAKNALEIYSFCNSTGKITGTIAIDTFVYKSPLFDQYYGLSFSLNSNAVYASYQTTSTSSPFSPDSSTVYQYNVQAGNSAAILASKTIIRQLKSPAALRLNGMQLAPNGKIYIAKEGILNLDVINSPNTIGLGCSYQVSGQSTTPGAAFYALPNYIESYLNPNQLSANLGSDVSLCGSSNIVLNPSATATNYLWSDGSTNSTLSVNTPGKYWVQVDNGGCCSKADTINILPSPSVNLGNDTTICGGSVVLDGQNAGGVYLWSNGVTTQTINVTTAGKYWVRVSKNSCIVSDTVNISVKAASNSFKVPNVFTPNGDNINDKFDLSLLNPGEINLKIFNRWGLKVFETSDIFGQWDGKISGSEAQHGVYYWVAEYTDGCSTSGEKKSEKGYVTLLR